MPSEAPQRVSTLVGAIAPSATLTIDAKARALRASGVKVVSFGAGEPDFPTPDYIVAAAVTSGGAISQPTRHPVMAYAFETALITTQRSASSGTTTGIEGASRPP